MTKVTTSGPAQGSSPREVGVRSIPRISRSGFVVFVWLIGIVFFALNGVWAFPSPRSFFDTLAHWTPYNAHFLRDAGAFSFGIAGALIGALRGSATTSALVGAAVGAGAHAISHVIDAGRGGRASDPYLLVGFAIVLAVGAGAARRAER